jgi:DNA-binding GntR family transcriptional regulator
VSARDGARSPLAGSGFGNRVESLPETYSDTDRHTARSFVFDRLREEILSGKLPAGTRLRQNDLAARLQVSTSPVREAFRQLATIGLVAIHPHRGATVVEPLAVDLSHMYQVRALLEPMCNAWAAQRISDGELDSLQETLDEMHNVQNIAEITALNRRFHGIVAAASGNPYLAQVVNNLLDLSTPYIGTIFRTNIEAVANKQAREHGEILTALRRRSPEQAYAASLHHLAPLNIDGTVSPRDAPFTDVWVPQGIREYLEAGFGAPTKPSPQRKKSATRVGV